VRAPGHNVRAFSNINEIKQVIQEFMPVEIKVIGSIDFCSQAEWMNTGLILSIHGSHLVNQAFMQPGAHLIEVQPYKYEQDNNSAGCASRNRYLLVGTRPCEAMCTDFSRMDANRCAEDTRCRICARATQGTKIAAPVAELRLLMQRIMGGSAETSGTYVCGAGRCAYT
jgi:hypothetical protein